jgi:hypothetical protein
MRRVSVHLFRLGHINDAVQGLIAKYSRIGRIICGQSLVPLAPPSPRFDDAVPRAKADTELWTGTPDVPNAIHILENLDMFIN